MEKSKMSMRYQIFSWYDLSDLC